VQALLSFEQTMARFQLHETWPWPAPLVIRVSHGNLQDMWKKAQPSLPTIGCMSAKSPGIRKRVPVFTTTTTITIDAGQQKQVRSTPPGLQKSKLP